MTKAESNMKIINLLAQGKIQKEIAEELGMPLPTVKDRILDLKKEYGTRTQTELVVKVIKENLLNFAGKR